MKEVVNQLITGMNKITWVIQNNLIHENDHNELQEAIIKCGVDYKNITVIPFDDNKLDFDHNNDNNIYYGSTSFTNYIIKHLPNAKGLFFNENFSMKNYIREYGELMLNADGLFTTLGKFTDRPLELVNGEEVYFIRPDADNKSFAGQVMTLKQIYDWSANLPITEKISVTLDTPILISDPYNIKKEWRNYVVGGKIVTSSRYQMNGRRSLSNEDIPEDMIEFAETCIAKYKPHDNFAIDIALCGDRYYIVECGCLNGVGLYKCNIDKLVRSISDWMV